MATVSNISFPNSKAKTAQKENTNNNSSEERLKEITDINKIIRLNNETWLDKAILSETRKLKIDSRLANDIHNKITQPILRSFDFMSLKPQAKTIVFRQLNRHILILLQDHLPKYSDILLVDEEGTMKNK